MTRRIPFVAVVLLFALFTKTAVAQELVLTITGIEPSKKGELFVGVYDRERTFRQVGQEVRGVHVEPQGSPTETVTIDRLPVGTYAVAIFHDENANGVIDKNWLGIPKEGYGFSNNVFGTFGPPDFEETTFTVTEGRTTSLSIRLKY